MLNEVVSRMLAGERVYPIAWHVDYWNYLGWTDRFSTPAISARHEHYSSVLSPGRMFTPAMYVNGNSLTTIALGSVNAAVTSMLDDPVSVSTTLWTDDPHATPLTVSYSVLDAPPTTTLFVVLVERGLSTPVTAGENAGRMLYHENSVRAFASAENPTSGTVDLHVPDDVVRESSSLIGIVQDWATLEMHGATSITLVM